MGYCSAPSDLLTNKGKLIYEQLRLLKAKRITKFIGISAYDKIQINKIIKKFKIDIIQIPILCLTEDLKKMSG